MPQVECHGEEFLGDRYLLNCSEATVNFHFSNIRRKFNTNSRQQAVVKAIHMGLINPT